MEEMIKTEEGREIPKRVVKKLIEGMTPPPPQEDPAKLTGELSALLRQKMEINERINALAEGKTRKKPKRLHKPKGKDDGLSKLQVSLILSLTPRQVTNLLNDGVLEDLHPCSIAKMLQTGTNKTRLKNRERHKAWKERWASYHAEKAADAEKRAENAVKLANLMRKDGEL